MNKEAKAKVLGNILVISVGAIVCAALYFGIQAYKKHQAKKAEEAEKLEFIAPDMKSDESRAAAIAEAEEYISNKLTDPASADFETAPAAYYMGDSTYNIRIYVDAKNVYGGTVRNHFFAKVRWLGGNEIQTWSVVKLDTE